MNYRHIIVEIVIVLCAFAAAWGAFQMKVNTDDKTLQNVSGEIQKLDAWRIHLNDYLEYKDPSAKAFLEHHPGDP